MKYAFRQLPEAYVPPPIRCKNRLVCASECGSFGFEERARRLEIEVVFVLGFEGWWVEWGFRIVVYAGLPDFQNRKSGYSVFRTIKKSQGFEP